MILFGRVSILLFPSKVQLSTGLLRSNGFFDIMPILCEKSSNFSTLFFLLPLHTGVFHMIHLKKATFMTSLLKKGGIWKCLSEVRMLDGCFQANFPKFSHNSNFPNTRSHFFLHSFPYYY